MKRVLIIGADFSPSSHPPALRLRFFAQHLGEFGWEPIVLTTSPRYYDSETDSQNEKLLPPALEVIRTRALPLWLTRKLGFSDAGLRSLWHHWQEISRLCCERRIDLIFIAVPPNPTMILGRMAHARFGIPYVIDYIDPVSPDFYWKVPRSQRPPKYALSYTISRLIERFALRRVSQIVGVSKGTTEVALSRYRWLKSELATEIPYGGEPADFDYLRQHPRKNQIFDRDDGRIHVSYIGAFTRSMEPILAALFSAIRDRRFAEPEAFSRLQLHFVGSNYSLSAASEERIRSLAATYGMSDLVDEHPRRVPYLDALNLLLESHALLAVGSVEPHYTASKVFPCILAAKPLLAIFHEESSVVPILRKTNAGHVVTFGDRRPLSAAVGEIGSQFQQLLELCPNGKPAIRWEAFEPYTTRAMSARLAAVLDKAAGQISTLQVSEPMSLVAHGANMGK